MVSKIETIIDAHVKDFVKEVSKKFDIDQDDLMDLWTSFSKPVEKKAVKKSEPVETKKSPVKKSPVKSKPVEDDNGAAELNKLTIKNLKDKLAALGVTEGVSGKTKNTLIEMILSKSKKSNEDSDDEEEEKPKKPVKKSPEPKISKVIEKSKGDSDNDEEDDEEEEEKPLKKTTKKTVKKEEEKPVKKPAKKEEEKPSKKIVSKTVKKVEEDDEDDEESVTSSKKGSPGGSGTCCYEFTKPPRAGELCGVKVRGDGEFCSKHKKAAEKSPKDKTAMPKPKSADDKKADNDDGESKKVVIRLNREIGKYWHPDTGFVFKSPEEKVVIGHLRDGTIHPLVSSQITKCKSLGFPVEEKEEEVEEEVEEAPVKSSPAPVKSAEKKSVLSGISLNSTKAEVAKAKLGGKKLGEEVKSMAAAIPVKPQTAADDDEDDIENVLAELQEEDEEILEDDE